MDIKIDNEQWVWVIVQNPGGDEKFLGQHDEEADKSFIPVFLEKEEAQRGLSVLGRDEGSKYEAQAIIYEEIAKHAAQQGFNLMVLDGEGKILKKG